MILASTGNNRPYGNRGDDLLGGDFGDYQLHAKGNGPLLVKGRGRGKGAEGADQLWSVERLDFADGFYLANRGEFIATADMFSVL